MGVLTMGVARAQVFIRQPSKKLDPNRNRSRRYMTVLPLAPGRKVDLEPLDAIKVRCPPVCACVCARETQRENEHIPSMCVCVCVCVRGTVHCAGEAFLG